MNATDTLKGELVTFEVKTPDGWGVGTVRTDEDAFHAVTGKMLGIQPGETVELEGAWAESKYGRQFRATRCNSTMPHSVAGVVAWMRSKLPDVGERRALQIVERFGVGTALWDTIENNPYALCTVDGITRERADKIQKACLANRTFREHLITLRGWGLSEKQISRCVERWHTLGETVHAIRENPYQLMDAVHGFGFKRADSVALRAGVLFDAPIRVAAALHHVLAEAMAARGHCWVTSGQLRHQTVKMLGVTEDHVREALATELRGKRMIRRAQRIYRRDLEDAESKSHDAVATMLILQRREVLG